MNELIRLYKTAKSFGYGIVETYNFIINRSMLPYELVWDYVIGEEG